MQAAGRRCGRCGDGRCADWHGFRYRKPITDLVTGAVFERVPIRRVRFCDGKAPSLVPAELWRGRSTVSSVLAATVRVLRDGLEAAYDWTWTVGPGEELVSPRTLGRWRELVRTRLVGSSLAWLGPRLGLSWSSTADEAAQLDTVVDRLTASTLAAFRAATGRAVLDKPRGPVSRARSVRRRVPGRLGPTSPHNPPSLLGPRGAWSRHRRRGPPPADPEEEE